MKNLLWPKNRKSKKASAGGAGTGSDAGTDASSSLRSTSSLSVNKLTHSSSHGASLDNYIAQAKRGSRSSRSSQNLLASNKSKRMSSANMRNITNPENTMSSGNEQAHGSGKLGYGALGKLKGSASRSQVSLHSMRQDSTGSTHQHSKEEAGSILSDDVTSIDSRRSQHLSTLDSSGKIPDHVNVNSSRTFSKSRESLQSISGKSSTSPQPTHTLLHGASDDNRNTLASIDSNITETTIINDGGPDNVNLTFENYDETVLKVGWLNKSQGQVTVPLSSTHSTSGVTTTAADYQPRNRESRIYETNTLDSSDDMSGKTVTTLPDSQITIPDYRVFRAQLKGSLLTLYKSSLGSHVKCFDPSLKSLESDLTTKESNRQSVIPSKSKQKSSTKNDVIPKSVTLKHLSVSGPHPDLKVDKHGIVIGGTVEAICHDILFTTKPIHLLHKKHSKISNNNSDDDVEVQKSLVNFLIILPMLDHFIKFIITFNQFGLTFTKHKSKISSTSSQYVRITEVVDTQISNRLVLVIRTILEFTPAYLLDDNIFQSIITLIDTISLHNDAICNQIKIDVATRCNELNKLTKFSKTNINNKDGFLPMESLVDVNRFMELDPSKFAEEVHSINLEFNKVWAPRKDFSLLYDSKFNNKNILSLSPLIFNNKDNVHFLGRLLVTHLFSTNHRSKEQCRKTAEVLNRWVLLGCKFEQLGDMVSWLAIATVICSIPILRLGAIWKYMPESTVKIILNDWVPTIVQLDRRQISSKSTGSVFILAPPNLDDPHIKNNIVSYFGDLIIHADDLPNDVKIKYLAKKINRTKNAFHKWQSRVDKDNSTGQAATFKSIDPNSSMVYDFWNFHIHQPPMNINDIMKQSIKCEPALVNQSVYSSIGHKRSSLMTGSYLPTLFNNFLNSYSIFPKEVLIGAAGVLADTNISRQSMLAAKELKISEPISQVVPGSLNYEHRYSQITGLDNIDGPVKKEIAGKPLNKHHLLKSIRDAFNVDLDVFHVGDDLVFKSITTNQGKSRPSSIVIDTPKRFSQYSTSNSSPSTPKLNRESTTIVRLSKGFENLDLFDNVGNLSDSLKELNIDVALKSASIERIYDLLVLTVSAFSRLVDSVDLTKYYKGRRSFDNNTNDLSDIGLLDFAYIKINMDNAAYTETFFNTYKSFTTTVNVLEGLARRFIGAKSCALSIEKIIGNENLDSLKDETLKSKLSQLNAKKFPLWDLNVNKNETVNLGFLAKVQIGAMEAIYYLVKHHYNDFTDDMNCHTTMLDIVKIIEEEITVEWEHRLKTSKENNLFDNVAHQELENLIKRLRELFNILKSTYRKQLYKPLNISKTERNSSNLSEQFKTLPYEDYIASLSEGEGDKLYLNFKNMNYDDYDSIHAWVNDINNIVTSRFAAVTRMEWFQLYQQLDLLSNASLTSFFQYPLSAKSFSTINTGNPLLNEVEITDVFEWISTLNTKTSDVNELFIDKIPSSIKVLIEMHNSLKSFFVSELANVSASLEERKKVYCTILQLLNYVRWKNSSLNLFEGEIDNENIISPHIPSFIETTLCRAIVSPESRFNELLWKHAHYTLSTSDDKYSLKSISNILDDLNVSHIRAFLEIDNVYTAKPQNLCPCPGWFITRLLEISQFVPNMSISNTKLVNFDKRRFVCNIIYNILEILPKDIELATTAESHRMLFTKLLGDNAELREKLRSKALEDAKEEGYQNTGIFNNILVDEVDKIRREHKKKESLTLQEAENQRSLNLQKNYAINKHDSLLLTSSTSNVSANSAHLLRNKRSSTASLASRSSVISGTSHSGVGRKIGGFFRRPFSISGFNSSGQGIPPNGVQDKFISPDNLPHLESNILQDYKPALTIKTFEIKSIVDIINHNKVSSYAHAFRIVMQDGSEHMVQAVSSEEALEWIRLIKISKRYSFHSKKYSGQTRNKIFGVPLEDLCVRENTLIPSIVVKLLEEIELRGLDEVGLYRVPGSVGSINALKNAFDEEGATNNTFTLEDDRWFEINAIAGCFKMYLRELPDSLFTNNMFGDFTKVALQYKTSAIDFEAYKAEIKRLLSLLPPCYYATLERIVIHLNKVHRHLMNNRMDASNLSIVFAMSFIDQDDLSSSMGPTLGAVQSILQKFITNPEDYF